MEMKSMKTTVIALAYKRKKFLASALDSVLENSKLPEQIILVKCFTDLDFDSNLASHGIEVYTLSDNTKYGDMLIYAIKKSSGDIIMLLEDDDMFLPKKIEYITMMYESNEDLIATKDLPFIYKGVGKLSDFESTLGSNAINSKLNFKDYKLPIESIDELAQLNGFGFSANPSTMSFNKKFMSEHLDILECNDPLDVMLGLTFLMANKGVIRLISQGLTIYRIHADNDSRILCINEKTINRMAATSHKYLDGLIQVRNIIQKNRFAIFFTDSIILRNKLIHSILKLDRNLQNIKDILSLFTYLKRIGAQNGKNFFRILINFLGFIPLEILIFPFQVFSPRVGRYVYLMLVVN